jgi:uncharacterized membrane protein YeiB
MNKNKSVVDTMSSDLVTAYEKKNGVDLKSVERVCRESGESLNRVDLRSKIFGMILLSAYAIFSFVVVLYRRDLKSVLSDVTFPCIIGGVLCTLASVWLMHKHQKIRDNAQSKLNDFMETVEVLRVYEWDDAVVTRESIEDNVLELVKQILVGQSFLQQLKNTIITSFDFDIRSQVEYARNRLNRVTGTSAELGLPFDRRALFQKVGAELKSKLFTTYS